MEESVITGLKCLNYHGDLSQRTQLKEVLETAEITRSFVQLVYWLVSELKFFCPLGEIVSGEPDTFPLELKGVLRELECPYQEMIGGDGIKTAEGKLFTLDYLISELQACRMNFVNSNTSKCDSEMETDTPISASLLTMIQTLNIPLALNVSQLFSSIEQKIKLRLQKASPDYLQEPLLKKELTTLQWDKVNQINDTMCQEYKTRRQVLIKRIDVTIQSFNWSEKVKNSSEKAAEMYFPLRSKLMSDSLFSIVDLLAARTDLYPIEKTSSGTIREATKCDLNKIMIGRVPDRGGRPSKTAPLPEMPKFQKRIADQPRGGGGGRGGGRGGRGGRSFDGGRDQGDGRGRGRGGWRGGRGGSRSYDNPKKDDQKMYYS